MKKDKRRGNELIKEMFFSLPHLTCYISLPLNAFDEIFHKSCLGSHHEITLLDPSLVEKYTTGDIDSPGA